MLQSVLGMLLQMCYAVDSSNNRPAKDAGFAERRLFMERIIFHIDVNSAYLSWSAIDLLKKNLFPILAGSAAGSAASMGSVWLLCRLFKLDEKVTVSLLPKSVTTPIAMGVSEQLGGIVSITVAAVVFTGILGAILAPLFIKLFRIKDPVAAGLAIGACSHAVGTSKALELGEAEGAMSSIAIGVCGLMTVLFSLFLH